VRTKKKSSNWILPGTVSLWPRYLLALFISSFSFKMENQLTTIGNKQKSKSRDNNTTNTRNSSLQDNDEVQNEDEASQSLSFSGDMDTNIGTQAPSNKKNDDDEYDDTDTAYDSKNQIIPAINKYNQYNPSFKLTRVKMLANSNKTEISFSMYLNSSTFHTY
jgi:hypothetical protein